MRNVIALLVTVTLAGLATVAAQDKKPPEKIVFPSKQGATTFLHARHIERQNGECTSCHDKLWPKSTAEPLKSSAGCRTCHKADGKAFAMAGNCERCHPKDSSRS
jgi:c(7)-type cytochrome triheme protein